MANFDNSVFINYVFQDTVIGATRSLTVYGAGNGLTSATDHKLVSSPAQPPYVFAGGGGVYIIQILWVPSALEYHLQYGRGLSGDDIVWADFRNSSDGTVYKLNVNPNRTQTMHIIFFNDTSIKLAGQYSFVGNPILPNFFGNDSFGTLIPPCSEFLRVITNNERNIVGPPVHPLEPSVGPPTNPGSGTFNNECFVGSVSVCSNVHLISTGSTFVRYVNHTGDNIYHPPVGTQEVSVNPGFNLISVVLATNLNGIDSFYTKLLKINATYYPLPFFVSTPGTNPSTPGGSDGSITVQVYATLPATVSFTGGNIVGTQTQTLPNPGLPPASANNAATIDGNLTAGTYTVVLTDYCGLTQTTTVILSDPPPFVINFDSILTPADGQGCTTVAITVTTNYHGFPDFHWYYPNGDEIPFDTTHFPTNDHLFLTLHYPEDPYGSYTFQLGQGLQYSYIPPTPLMHFIDDSHVTCEGKTGTLTETITGGSTSATYTYQWFNENNLSTVIGTTQSIVVPPGTYIVDVKSSVYDYAADTTYNACFRDRGTMISSNPLILTTNSYPIALTTSQPTGIIFADVTGGTLPYTYVWTKNAVLLPNTVDHVENATGGTYEVTVTDKYGCTQTSSYFLAAGDDPTPGPFDCSQIILKSSVTDIYASCTTHQGTLTVNLINTGALPPTYDYKWYNVADLNTVLSTTNTLTGPIGTYVVFIADSANNLCSSASGKILAALELTTTITAHPLTVECSTDTAIIFVDVIGGVPPYTYQWTLNTNNLNNTSDQVTNAVPGNYTVTVTDSTGCVSVQEYDLLVNSIAFECSIADDYASCITNQGTLTVKIINSGSNVPNYTYKWHNATDFNTIISTAQSITVGPGTYYVFVEDTVNGSCCDSNGSVLVAPELITSIESQPLTVDCSGDVATIYVNATGGIPPYTFEWKFNNTTIDNIGDQVPNAHPGTYQATVTDGNGCVSTKTYNLLVVPPIAFKCSVADDYASCTTNQGILTVNIINGGSNIPNYVYKWYNTTDLNTVISTAQSITVSSGTYYVFVEDTANGLCCDSNGSVLVAPELITSIESQPLTIDCDGDVATIYVNVVGGISPYTFEWKFNDTTIDNIGDQVSNASPGIYQVTVTDSNGCVSTQTYNLLVVNHVAFKCYVDDDYASCITNQGTLTVNVINGGSNVPNYVYKWYNTTDLNTVIFTTQSITVGPGTYYVFVEDTANGLCCDSSGIVLVPPELITSINSQPLTVDCDGDVATIYVNVEGGIAPYTYEWKFNDNKIDDIGPQVINAHSGTYQVTVTDSNGCISTQTYNLLVVKPVAFKCYVDDDYASCTTNQGTLSVEVINGGSNVPNYVYKWYNTTDLNTVISTVQSITVSPGTYYVFVEDTANGLCCDSSGIVLVVPELITSIESQPLTVDCDGDVATIYVNVVGGIPPYTYEWKFNDTPISNIGDQVTNASPGTYQVTVTDSNGCVSTQTYNLLVVKPVAFKCYVDDDYASCITNQGTLSVEIINGGSNVPNYVYKWYNTTDLNTVISTAQSITVSPGTYYVFVEDTANGLCCDSSGIVLVAPELITSISSQPLTVDCDGDVATIYVNVEGGLPPYSYEWKFNDIKIDDIGPQVINASSGIYQVTVTDSNGCVSTQTYNLLIVQSPAFKCSVNDDYALCTTNQGTLTVNVINGGSDVPNYVYKWYNVTDLNTVISTAQSITVGPGNYYVLVEDTANGLCCDSSAHVLVAPELSTTIESQPSAVNCAGDVATIYANVVGGMQPYSYEWKFNDIVISNTGDQVTNAHPGTYEVTVTDSNGCVSTQTYNLVVVQAPAFAAYIINDHVNSITNLGTLTVNIINSQLGATYTYKWYNVNDFSTVVSTGPTVTGPVGTYYVYVEDTTNGLCSTTNGMILSVPDLNVTTDSQSGQLKFLTDTAVIFANVFGGIGPFTYDWKYNGVSINVHADHVTDATVGDYEVIVTDSTGQTAVSTYSLIFAPVIIFDVFVNNVVASPITGLGTLVATVINSAPNPDYHYVWYNVNDFTTIISTSPSITVPVGTYYVSVTDVNNNLFGSATGSVINIPPSTLSAIIFSEPVVLQSFDDRGVIIVDASGGTAPYTYAWKYNGVPINNTQSTLSNADAGLYEVIVTDSNNYSVTVSYTLTKPSELEIEIYKKYNVCCDKCSNKHANGELHVKVSGGVKFNTDSVKYLYMWFNVKTGEFISNKSKITHLKAGVYQVRVTDQNGTTKIRNVTLCNDKRKCYCNFNKWLLHAY